MYETEKNSGISHFLEHAIIRNINARMGGRLYPMLDKYGLEFNASTYTEMVQFYISGASHAFPVAAEIIAAVLAPLELSRLDFEAERSRIRAEIREAEDRTSLSAFTLREVFGDNALSRPITGSGGTVSGISRKSLEDYFSLEILRYEVKQPMLVTETEGQFDVTINLDGGGIKGQAEAARMGIARALCEVNAEYRSVLKKNGFLTRDSREVERKKPGQPGARRKFQFSKR
jgi:small subunit ribosomal protein S9